MKHFKKFFSYLVALTMVLSLAAFTGTKVYADDTTPTTYTLTINNVIKGHTLKMYQVLTGDLSTKDGKKVLSNAKWGNGVTSIKISDTETLTANNGEKVSDADMSKLSAPNFDPSTSITVNSDDKDSHVYSYNGIKAVKTVGDEKSVVFNTVEAGYYVVTDTAPDDSDNAVKQTKTKSIVQIVGNTVIEEKAGTVESEKKVEDVNDSTGTTTKDQSKTNLLGKDELIDSADYDIGDSINYTIEAKLPENYAAYDTFPLTFVDTMSKGLTYNAQSAVLHLSGKNTAPLEPTNKSVNYQDPDNSNAEDKSATQYKWTIENLKDLDSNLKAGDIVYITYSATLNSQAVVGSEGNPNKMHIEFNSNPYSDNTTIKKTPDDTNIVFTYEAVFNKVDQNNKPLTGADFTLYKFVEGTGKDSYKEGDKTYSGTWTDVTTLHNGENKPSKETKANGEAKNATFTFKGIDDGYYKLEETGVPSGYNKMEDKYFTITAGHDILSSDPSLTSLNVTGDLDSTITDKTATADKNAGTISANIENKPGSTLPSTGGMGTTLLYVAGGILVACAAAYVVMSRKHSTNK